MKYTADMLFSIEPKLQEIILAAKGVENTINKDRAYIFAKDLADGLVGYGAENPALQNEAAYSAFINHVCDSLGY